MSTVWQVNVGTVPQVSGGVPASVWVSWRTLIELTDTLDTDLGTHLHRLCRAAVELTDVSEAAAVAADPSGALAVVAASSDRTYALAEREIQLAEGPVVTSHRHGETVRCPDGYAAERWWPRLAPAIHDAGIHAVHAIPMWHRTRTFGALALYSVWSGALDPSDEDLACALTDAATIGMLQLRRAEQRAPSDDGTEDRPMPTQRDDDLSGHINAIIDQYDKAHQQWRRFPRVYEDQLKRVRESLENANDERIGRDCSE